MTDTRVRDDRGHYLPTGDEPYTLDPEAWDDTCRHQSRPTDLKPSTETFGHEPFVYDGVPICARCYTVGVRCSMDAFDNPHRITVRNVVLWPCTSAVVLGLASA